MWEVRILPVLLGIALQSFFMYSWIITRFSPTMRPARLVRRWILSAFTRREHRQSRTATCRWGFAINLPLYSVVLRLSFRFPSGGILRSSWENPIQKAAPPARPRNIL